MEEAYKRGHSKKLFANVKKLSGDINNRLINIEPVKEANGELITEKKKIMELWKEHFEELLNREEPKETEKIINEIDQMESLYGDEDEYMAEDVSLEKLKGQLDK